MSGSSNRYPGRPPPQMPADTGYDPYGVPTTASPRTHPLPEGRGPGHTSGHHLDYDGDDQHAAYGGRQVAAAPNSSMAAPAPSTTDESLDNEMYAPTRETEGGRKMKTTSPVVPPASVTGRSLTLVIAIMCFLASLTAGAVWMIKDSSDAWMRDIASEVTVQVEPQQNTDIEKSLTDVIGFLAAQPGIRSARPLSLDVSAELLEPWLGSSDVLKTLPVPRLIAIELDRNSPPDLSAVSAGLARDFKGVSLDDHRRWQSQIQTVTRSFALGGLAILALVAAATMAIIVSATKSAMSSNREIVEVLHFVGATDKFIAREFEKHFLRVGIKAGIVGAALAALVFLGMPIILQLLGGGAVSAVEMQRLIGSGALDATGYALLGVVVVTIAGLCMITSRIGVKRILQGRH